MKRDIRIIFVMMVLSIMIFVKVTSAGPGVVTIGTGIETTPYPYYTYFSDARSNFLYTAAEIIAASGWAGDITGLAFNAGNASPVPMNGFNIRMQSTPATSLTGFTNTGWTTVYSGTYTVPGTGWQQIIFTTPFSWDGISSLMVEVCFDNTSYIGASYVYASVTSGKMRGQATDDASGCDLAQGYAWTIRPNIRLNMNTAPPGGTLQGTVTKCCSGTPLPGATITCGGMTATTGTGGTFTINGIPPGTHSATCSYPPLYLPKAALVMINTYQTTIQNFCLDSPPLVITGTITNVHCHGEASGGISTVVSGGVPPYTYNWSNGYHAPAITGLAAGTYTLCVSDANSCTSCKVFSVTEPAPLYISAGTDQLVYYGYPLQPCATLSWSGGSGGIPPYSIRWNTGQTTPSITVCPSITTDYTVTITDANNCTFSDDVKVCVIDVRCGTNMDKVQVCHNPHGTSGNPQTLCLAVSAVPGHLEHGDLLGECGMDLTCAGSKSLAGNPGENNLVANDGPIFLKAFPNPFSENVEVTFKCPSDGHVTLKLFDHTGKEAALLYDQFAEKGVFYSVWVDGAKLSQGLYFYMLRHSDGTMKIQKLIRAN